MTKPSSPGAADSRRPVATAAEAQELVAQLNSVMDALLAIVQEETELVRAGRLGEVAHLTATKTDLAHLYLADVERVKANKGYLLKHSPKLLQDLRRRHDEFHCLLQVNLTVLATAHAVAEGIVRGVASELNAKAAPQVYGAGGRQSAPRPQQGGRPLAVSRSL